MRSPSGARCQYTIYFQPLRTPKRATIYQSDLTRWGFTLRQKDNSTETHTITVYGDNKLYCAFRAVPETNIDPCSEIYEAATSSRDQAIA